MNKPGIKKNVKQANVKLKLLNIKAKIVKIYHYIGNSFNKRLFHPVLTVHEY